MVTPIIVGSLAAGLIAMLSLQQGVTEPGSPTLRTLRWFKPATEMMYRAPSRLRPPPTRRPIRTPPSAEPVFKYSASSGTLPTTHLYQTVVSYVSVPIGTGSTITYSLVRQECTNVVTPASNIEPVTSTTTISSNLAANLAASENPPTVLPGTAAATASTGWGAHDGRDKCHLPHHRTPRKHLLYLHLDGQSPHQRFG